MMPQIQRNRPVLLFAAATLLLCMGCVGGRNNRRAQNDEAEIESSGHPPLEGIQLTVSGGKPDTADLYPTVVIVESDSAPNFKGPGGSCSGVLIERDLVLTAAHCMCMQARLSARNKILDKSACATSAVVRRYLVKTQLSSNGGLKSMSIEYPDFKGQAFLPDEFRMEVTSQGIVDSIRADLAIIRLKEKIDITIDHKLAERESEVDDRLFVVGFGSTTKGGQDFSPIRHFGDNTVTGIQLIEYKSQAQYYNNPSDDEQHLETYFHRENEANVETGDSGGPCFREETPKNNPTGKPVRWLVGIINGKRASAAAKTSCISTFRSRGLIENLIIKARAGSN